MSWGNPQSLIDHIRVTTLTPITWPYALAVKLHRFLYDKKYLAIKRLSVPVISVGNITVGGTGKTPIIVELASQLLAHNIKVGVLSRGYKRAKKNRCVVVSDGRGNFAPIEESGDEALMIAKMLPAAVVIVDIDRVAAGQKAINDYSCEVLLLDDGYQHRRLHRDCNIVLIDYADEPKKDSLVPAGRLRESLSSLDRATHIVITKVPENYDAEKLQRLKNLIALYAPQAEINICQFIADSSSINKLKSTPVFAFCGIARPRSFFDLLIQYSIKVSGKMTFADHHHYSVSDLNILENKLKESGAKYLVTTNKDLVKLQTSSIAPYLLSIGQNIKWLGEPLNVVSSTSSSESQVAK